MAIVGGFGLVMHYWDRGRTRLLVIVEGHGRERSHEIRRTRDWGLVPIPSYGQSSVCFHVHRVDVTGVR